jgi:hypothetical protein
VQRHDRGQRQQAEPDCGGRSAEASADDQRRVEPQQRLGHAEQVQQHDVRHDHAGGGGDSPARPAWPGPPPVEHVDRAQQRQAGRGGQIARRPPRLDQEEQCPEEDGGDHQSDDIHEPDHRGRHLGSRVDEATAWGRPTTQV